MKWYQALRIAEVLNVMCIVSILLFHLLTEYAVRAAFLLKFFVWQGVMSTQKDNKTNTISAINKLLGTCISLVKEIQKSFRVTCILCPKVVLLQVFSDYYERVVKFLPVELWCLDEENSASYTVSGDVQPTVWDWIGVFKVLMF
jgi:hypothetical protein